MATGVDDEVAKYRKMLRNGGTIPTEEAGLAPARNPIGKRKKNPQVAGRFQDLNAFIDQTMASLTRAEIATWMTMFRYVDSKRNTVTVSVRTIAERTGTSVRHVHNAIGLLTAKGLLERIKTGGINTGSSVYKINPTVNP